MIEGFKIKPMSAIFLPTLGCNLRCKMCYHWLNNEQRINRPDIRQWKDFIDSFKEIVDGGVGDDRFTVIFGGGEPLIFAEEVIEMIGHCASRGYRTSLATNGYILDRIYTKRLIDSGLNNIGLSLDSLDEKTHDYLRGISGSYSKVMSAIKRFKEFSNSNIRIAINTIIMAPNLDGIMKLVDYVRKESRIFSILFQAIVQPFHTKPQQDWWENSGYSFLWPTDIKTVTAVIDSLIELKKAPGYMSKIDNSVSQLRAFKAYFENPDRFIKSLKCNAAESGFFTIGPDGNINLCPYMVSIGNIKEGSLKDIWNSEKAIQIRERMLICRQNCHHLINCWFEEK